MDWVRAFVYYMLLTNLNYWISSIGMPEEL